MSSILTNNSAMNALSTLRSVNNRLGENQGRISSGLKIQSGKDNAAYFAISETMSGDSGMYKAIDESLTLTKNSVSTARLGAETARSSASRALCVGVARTNPRSSRRCWRSIVIAVILPCPNERYVKLRLV